MKASNSTLRHEIPEAGLRRLPIYYRCLQEMLTSGLVQVSCVDIARVLGLDPTLVRKDIEVTGIVGKPRVGYPLADLMLWLENFLGWNRPKDAVLVGAGSLGSALLGYERFRTHGMKIVAAFDVDPARVGQTIHGAEVRHLQTLPDFVCRTHIHLGLIATPGHAAQAVANLMVAGGILAIWNFAPAHIQVPERVILQNEDLYHSLASLSYKLEKRMEVPPIESEISYAEDN